MSVEYVETVVVASCHQIARVFLLPTEKNGLAWAVSSIRQTKDALKWQSIEMMNCHIQMLINRSIDDLGLEGCDKYNKVTFILADAPFSIVVKNFRTVSMEMNSSTFCCLVR